MPPYQVTYSSIIRNTVEVQANSFLEAQLEVFQLPIETLIVDPDFRKEICVEKISEI